MAKKDSTVRIHTVDTDDLAALLSAVLNHPALPDELEAHLGEGLTEVFNDLGRDAWKQVEYSPQYIALLLKASAEV